MRHDKEKAFVLRKEGKSYREIQEILSVSKSTLCDWFRNEEWSKHIKKSNTVKHIKLSTEHIKRLNEGRRVMLEQKYKNVEEEAEKEFEIYKNDPLFMAGLMLYAGEGDKRTRNISRISNSEFYIHKIFIKFAEKYLGLSRENIKIGLIVYPDNNQTLVLNKWKNELNISELNFHKTYTIQGKGGTKKLQYGIANSILSSRVAIKKKILIWLELCKNF